MKTRMTKRENTVPLLIAAAMVSLLVSCGPGMKYMAEQESKPRLVIKPGVATLVIARPSSVSDAAVVNAYLDGRLIGRTRGCSFFITEVTPGTHYVMAQSENVATVRLDLEGGRVYFLEQKVRPGPWKSRTELSTMTLETAMKQISDRDCAYWAYDREHPVESMRSMDYHEALDHWEKEVQQGGTPNGIVEYRGYDKIE